MNKIVEVVYRKLNFDIPVILSVSGGKDSVVLLDTISRFRKKFSISPRVVHFNHHLRRCSNEDADFVKKLSDRAGFDIKIIDLDVKQLSKKKKYSLEEAARILRYRELAEYGKEICKSGGVIFTAHTASDQAETVLFRIIKGTGKGGIQGVRRTIKLSGGWKVNRPLLSITSAEIYDYIKRNKLEFRQDETNRDISIPRNFIRHKLIPQIKKINPSFEKNIYKETKIFNQEEKVLESIVDRSIKKINFIEEKDSKIIELESILSYNAWLIQRLLKKISPVPLNAQNIFALVDLLNKEGTLKYIDLGDDWIARKEYGRLIIEKGFEKSPVFKYSIKPGVNFYIPEIRKRVSTRIVSDIKSGTVLKSTSEIEYFDRKVLKAKDIVLRSKEKGDKFIPWGMKGTKKISNFCIDEKLTFKDRNRLLIVENRGQIMWIAPFRRSDIAPVRKDTESILEIKVENER